ncbi:MAG: response regulator [Desulfobacterales bacterium]|nr:response regulator [Desulfobacterales bacterium]
MSDGLDVIIVDDDQNVCELLAQIINRFYTWGDVFVFSDINEAIFYCMNRDSGIVIFVVDVFLGEMSGFAFLDAMAEKYGGAHEDAVIITGDANDDVVNMCVASNVNHLLEKPVRPYALQFAIRAIASKYLNFLRRLREDDLFCRECEKFY